MRFFNLRRRPGARPVCADCGSPDIEAHAFVEWNVKLQDWQVREVLTGGSCSECGNTDVKLAWQES